MITGKTQTGFEFELDDDVLDDMELLDALASADKGNPLGYSEALDIMLGEEEKKRLYDHVRNEKGRVKLTALSEEILSIIGALGKPGKNS